MFLLNANDHTAPLFEALLRAGKRVAYFRKRTSWAEPSGFAVDLIGLEPEVEEAVRFALYNPDCRNVEVVSFERRQYVLARVGKKGEFAAVLTYKRVHTEYGRMMETIRKAGEARLKRTSVWAIFKDNWAMYLITPISTAVLGLMWWVFIENRAVDLLTGYMWYFVGVVMVLATTLVVTIYASPFVEGWREARRLKKTLGHPA